MSKDNYIIVDGCKDLCNYGCISLLSVVYSNNSKIYLSVTVDIDDEGYDTCLLSEVSEELLNSFLNSDTDLLKSINNGISWNLCRSISNRYDILESYSNFSEIPDEYLPDPGYYHKDNL